MDASDNAEFSDDNEEDEWIYDADEWEDWFSHQNIQNRDNDFDQFLPPPVVQPSLPVVLSRVRRQVASQNIQSSLKDFDPKEVIHAFRENFTPVMLFTIIIFWLVSLVLPLLFSTEYIAMRPDRKRRTRKVSPEDQEPELGSEPEDVEFFHSVTQSTQLALDDEDDIMSDVKPSDIQFTIVARPTRFSLPQSEEPPGNVDTSGFAIHSKPSKQTPFQPPRHSDPLNPAVVRVPTTLRIPKAAVQSDAENQVYATPSDDSNTARLREPTQPHPLAVARQNQGKGQPDNYGEEDVVVRKRPKGKNLVKLASVHSQTSRDRIAPLAPVPDEQPAKVKKPNSPVAKPTENSKEPISLDTEPVQGLGLLEQQPGTSRNADDDNSSKNRRKKCKEKVLVGNSTRFQTGLPVQKYKNKKSNKDLKKETGCPCPFPAGGPKNNLKDLNWTQMLAYAQADGGWYDSEGDPEQVQDPDPNLPEDKQGTKKDKGNKDKSNKDKE